MHTEKQASELWCPMVRVAVAATHGGPVTVNDPTSLPDFRGQCLGARCAMWRWLDPWMRGTKQEERKGYCGLAGRGAM